MNQEDTGAIRQFLGGDDEGFHRLVHNWYKPILGYLSRQTGNVEDARELTQETFRTVYEKLPALKETDRFAPWLYRIALNHFRMRARRKGPRLEDSLDQHMEAGAEPRLGTLFGAQEGVPDPEESLGRADMERCVRLAIERLEPRLREVVLLKEYEGLKFHEIAAVLDCPVSTVKSRMYLGLETLRREIARIVKP